MTSREEVPRIARASREISADGERIFELIADPAQQPRWDGNDNLAEAASGQRARAVGEVFTMTLAKGSVRENHVVEFDEGRRITSKPAEAGQEPPGHLWRWELEPVIERRRAVALSSRRRWRSACWARDAQSGVCKWSGCRISHVGNPPPG